VPSRGKCPLPRFNRAGSETEGLESHPEAREALGEYQRTWPWPGQTSPMRVCLIGRCGGGQLVAWRFGCPRSWRRRSCNRRMPALEVSSPRQPPLARSRTAQTRDRQVLSPGRRPVTFTRRRLSAKVRSSSCCAGYAVLGREMQVGGERAQVRAQALDCAGIAGAPLRGEVVGALQGDGDRLLARRRLEVVEDVPVVLLHRLLVGLADLGDQVAGDLDGAADAV
jgi:hypothetical protein